MKCQNPGAGTRGQKSHINMKNMELKALHRYKKTTWI